MRIASFLARQVFKCLSQKLLSISSITEHDRHNYIMRYKKYMSNVSLDSEDIELDL